MDPEVPGSIFEWEPIFYKAHLIAQGLPNLHYFVVVHRNQRSRTQKDVIREDKLIDGCSLELC